MCELTSKEYLLSLIRERLQCSASEPILWPNQESLKLSRQILFGVKSFEDLVTVNCQTLRGLYGSSNYGFADRGDTKEENYWWKLDDLRFVQLLAINALKVLTFDCEEGELHLDADQDKFTFNCSLSGTCDIETYRKIQTTMEKRGFQCCRVVYTTVSLIQSQADPMVLWNRTYPVFTNMQDDRFVQFRAS